MPGLLTVQLGLEKAQNLLSLLLDVTTFLLSKCKAQKSSPVIPVPLVADTILSNLYVLLGNLIIALEGDHP